ncbi:MAG: hypothetical protein GX425_17360 [Peptococcaceae bacterium]|nr:hypothetical protein [Peptococcaceae bacterium]
MSRSVPRALKSPAGLRLFARIRGSASDRWEAWTVGAWSRLFARNSRVCGEPGSRNWNCRK